MDANALYTLKHLSDIELSALISKIGLYTPILVDAFSTKTKYDSPNTFAIISPDVKQLYSLLTLKEPLYLPCASCKKELAFSKIHSTDRDNKLRALVSTDIREQELTGYTSDPSKYYLYSDVLFIVSDQCKEDGFKAAGIACKKVLADNLPFFLVELSCSLKPEHTIRCMFSLSPFKVDDHTEMLYRQYLRKKLTAKIQETIAPEYTDEEIEAAKLYEMSEHTMVLKKVGQSPSLADIQFFDLQKYRKLLRAHYQELTKAIGLYSSGVGIGAFVYLRRIFEAICEEAHQECISLPDWDDDEYIKKRFNEKMDYLTQFGKQVLPNELMPVKSKLYGVMSKGVHEYSESECQELFPYMKTAIELILDQKLSNIEKQKKVDELNKVIRTTNI